MRHVISIISVRLVCLLLAGLKVQSLAGQYGESFDAFAEGTASFPAATGELFSTHSGTASRVMDNTMRELQLTADGTGGTFAAFRLPDLDPGNGVAAFSAKWNAQIYGSTGDGLADGFSFSFGPLSNAGSFFLNTTNPNESGFGVGLAVGITTYDGNTPGYYVRVNGKVVPGGFVAKSGSAWGNFNATRHFFEVDWHALNGLTLRVDGTTIFTNLPTAGFVPDIGHRFVFGARTGGLDQEVRLDNITIVTGGILTPVAATAPYYFSRENQPNEGAAKAFDNDANTKWLATSATATLGASMASAKTIRAYTLTSANDVPARDPKNWAFETGDNGTSWTSRGTKSTQYFLNRFEKRAFLVTTPAANSKFRLNITANNGGVETQLADLQAWELAPGPAFFKVFSTADSGPDSLRSAINTATANSGQALITFSSSLAGSTITPGSEFSISDSDGLAIDATNLTGGIILNGNNARRIMSNNGTGPIHLRGLTFTGGNGVSTLSTGGAGALFSANGSITVLSRCTFHGNNATNGNGGGLVNLGQMTLTDSVFYNNQAKFQGGAIHSEKDLAISRCTITGNTAGSYGGGIENQNRLSLSHSTVCFNVAATAEPATRGGGLDSYFSGASPQEVYLSNSIFWGNTGSGGAPDDIFFENCILARAGANIAGVVQQSGSTGGQSGPAFLNADPLLAPLGNYGGPTKTMTLRPGSPARDAATGSPALADQRGLPILGTPDVGACEAGTIVNYDNWIWEALPGPATNAQHATDADFDNDGQTNEGEWLAQTEPANANSFFRITAVTKNGDTLIITFPTLTGRSYAAEYSLDNIGWTSLGYAPGTGNIFNVNIGPLTGITRFYARCRIKLP